MSETDEHRTDRKDRFAAPALDGAVAWLNVAAPITIAAAARQGRASSTSGPTAASTACTCCAI